MIFDYEDTMMTPGGFITATLCRVGWTNVCCSSCTVGTGDTTVTVLGP